MFCNPTIQSTIHELDGNLFVDLCGFGIYSSPDAVYYYLMDRGANEVYILNDEWKFIKSIYFTYPAYMISIGNSLYMTGFYNVWKVDQDLNILINYNPGATPAYCGISCNPSNGLIYVVATNINEIQVFNLDLFLIRRFSTLPHKPFSITESSKKLYVGTYGGIILIYQNEIIINQFNACDGNSGLLSAIFFDSNGYMATICDDPTYKLYLFSSNGSFTDKSLKTPPLPRYIGFDSKDQFIQISWKQISIYNLIRK